MLGIISERDLKEEYKTVKGRKGQEGTHNTHPNGEVLEVFLANH